MSQRRTFWNWVAAGLSFVTGLILVLNDSAAGWIFFILGIGYLGLGTPAGQAWASTNPRVARWGLISVVILLLLLLLVGLAMFFLK